MASPFAIGDLSYHHSVSRAGNGNGSAAIRLAEQLRQPRDVDGDPSGLVLRQHLRLPCFGFVVAGMKYASACPLTSRTTWPPGIVSACQGVGKRRGGLVMAPTYHRAHHRPFGAVAGSADP
jgi:hypothetical protein